MTLWAVAHQAPLSLGFSKQEYWSGLPCPPPGDLPKPVGNKAAYIHLRGSDLRPQFHQFTAVPHPDVKPMAYASTLLQLGMM